MTKTNKRLKIFTWHIHSSYLYYLSFCDVDFFIPVSKQSKEGYGDLENNFLWRENVYEIEAKAVKDYTFDAVLFQSSKTFLEDQYEILSDKQRKVPQIYVEHDPPRQHPTDTEHVTKNSEVLLVQVTQFNRLMWDSGSTETVVVPHGVPIPTDHRYVGDLGKGVVVINNLQKRGRRLGLDIFEAVSKEIPLDLIGMNAVDLGGLGEIAYKKLLSVIKHYRFFFYPVRYTSLGLTLLEAMSLGMPVVALPTTELPMVLENGVSGYMDFSTAGLITAAKKLLGDKEKARGLGQGAKKVVRKNYSIERFKKNWEEVFHYTVHHRLGNPLLLINNETDQDQFVQSQRFIS